MITAKLLYLIGITLSFSFVTAAFYYLRYHKRNISIAIIIYSLLVFCIVYFVSFENNLGLGIGLLGILSLVRLRSTPENPIDIGFVFYSITIGLLNASIESILTIIVIDFIITTIVLLLSLELFFKYDINKTEIVFDDLIAEKLSNKEKLTKKVTEQFGITPVKVKVKNINYLKDSITIVVTYNAKDY